MVREEWMWTLETDTGLAPKYLEVTWGNPPSHW